MLPVKVLFLCTGNSCRSQMAEGLLRHLGKGAVSVASAGTHPKPVHPDAVGCLREIGVDISAQHSKPIDQFLGRSFDYVITVCDVAMETCPVFAGAAEMLHWSLPDPAAAQGADEERLRMFRSVREQLITHIEDLLRVILDRFLNELAHASAQGSHVPPETP